MAIIFTICSNNYLAQASVLEQSLKKYNGDIKFFTVLVDEFSPEINYSQLPFTCIEIKAIEPNIENLFERYDIVELNTCVKPTIFQYFFENFQDEEILYFDPDIKIFSSLEELINLLKINNVILTPHIITPIPLDGNSPNENVFLNYGLYNLGFIGIKKTQETFKFIAWWKERTYLNGYNKVCEGIFVDQLYINLVPLFFDKVFVIRDKGYNMAPWNIHERYLTKYNEMYLVNEEEYLKFFHFSSFKLDSGELPLHFYNRFNLKNREDLEKLYSDYNHDLKEAKHAFFKTIQCVYYEQYNTIKKKQNRLKNIENWNKKPLEQKLIIKILKSLPQSLLQKIKNIINASDTWYDINNNC